MGELSQQVAILHSVEASAPKKRKPSPEVYLTGAHHLVKIVENYATIQAAGTVVFKPAYQLFQRSLRQYLFTILPENDGRDVPPGERGQLQWLPDADTHRIALFPSLRLPLDHHPLAFHSLRVCALTTLQTSDAKECLD